MENIALRFEQNKITVIAYQVKCSIIDFICIDELFESFKLLDNESHLMDISFFLRWLIEEDFLIVEDNVIRNLFLLKF